MQAAITNGQVQITGNYTVEEANALKTIIDSGSLPVSLSIEQASTVGPTLGQQALWSGILAALIGIALVIVWMLVFYKGLGLLPAASIFLMSVVYLGLLALLSQVGWFSLTLPGIAGIIVNIGMSADSSILIMECFHEQIREGKSVKTAATAGVKEGIFTSLDADVVTLVSALILYFFAMGDRARLRPYARARHHLRPRRDGPVQRAHHAPSLARASSTAIPRSGVSSMTSTRANTS